MAPKRKKQSGISHDGTRWSSDTSGVVSYKIPAASVWTKFRMSKNELDPEAAITARLSVRFAAASHAASPAAPPVDSTSPAPPTAPRFEAASPPSSDPPPKVSHASASHKPHRPPACTQITEVTAVHPTTALHHLLLHVAWCFSKSPPLATS